MISTIGVSNLANMVLFLSFGHLIFEICFGFRCARTSLVRLAD
jgi:hypothetical protein